MPLCRQKLFRPACAFAKYEILVCKLALLKEGDSFGNEKMIRLKLIELH